MPPEMEDYLFDLRGYIVLKNAISPSLLEALNSAVDAFSPVQKDEWLAHGSARRVNAGQRRILIYRYDLGNQSLRVSTLRRLARAVDARTPSNHSTPAAVIRELAISKMIAISCGVQSFGAKRN